MSVAGLKVLSNGGWKKRLEEFHRHGHKRDYFGGEYDSNVLRSALSILNGHYALVFPAKSYIVAICYAERIADITGEDFTAILAYPKLLHDDEHFVPYNEESAVLYDTLIPLALADNFKQTDTYEAIVTFCHEELGISGIEHDRHE